MTVTDLTADRWYRRFHARDTAPVRLVCFPHAGGTAGWYHPLSAALSPYSDVLAAQYPGRQDRYAEPGITSLDLLADRLYRTLQPYADRPLVLFGHSMGASLAFEVARRFEADDRPHRAGGPVHLVLSGRGAPSLDRDEPKEHMLSDGALLERVTDLGGTDPRLLAEPELRELILVSLRSDYTAVDTYRAAPGARVGVPVTALTGDADPRVTPDEAAGWAAHTDASFDLRVFPGGHFYLADRMREVADVIAERLRAAAPVTE
ncbi:thioesterase II family protein [Kitasatospora sp. NPDC054939]